MALKPSFPKHLRKSPQSGKPYRAFLYSMLPSLNEISKKMIYNFILVRRLWLAPVLQGPILTTLSLLTLHDSAVVSISGKHLLFIQMLMNLFRSFLLCTLLTCIRQEYKTQVWCSVPVFTRVKYFPILASVGLLLLYYILFGAALFMKETGHLGEHRKECRQWLEV